MIWFLLSSIRQCSSSSERRLKGKHKDKIHNYHAQDETECHSLTVIAELNFMSQMIVFQSL